MFIVLGYMGELIREKFGAIYNGLSIEYIKNEEYATTGSMYSLSKTEGLIDDDILLLESDLLYESCAIKFLLDDPEKNIILTAELSGSNDEVFICVDSNNNLSDLGKDITNKEKAIGELVGISKLSKDFVASLYRVAEEEYAKGEKKQHYEEVISRLSKSISVKCLLKRIIWTEIDKEMDFIRARDYIFPKLGSI